jgi:hypothetical protein
MVRKDRRFINHTLTDVSGFEKKEAGGAEPGAGINAPTT